MEITTIAWIIGSIIFYIGLEWLFVMSEKRERKKCTFENFLGVNFGLALIAFLLGSLPAGIAYIILQCSLEQFLAALAVIGIAIGILAGFVGLVAGFVYVKHRLWKYTQDKPTTKKRKKKKPYMKKKKGKKR